MAVPRHSAAWLASLRCLSQNVSERETERELEIKPLSIGKNGSDWRLASYTSQIITRVYQFAAAAPERTCCINGKHPLDRGRARHPRCSGCNESHRCRDPIRVDLIEPRSRGAIIGVEPHPMRHSMTLTVAEREAFGEQSLAILRPEILTSTSWVRIRLLPAEYRALDAAS